MVRHGTLHENDNHLHSAGLQVLRIVRKKLGLGRSENAHLVRPGEYGHNVLTINFRNRLKLNCSMNKLIILPGAANLSNLRIKSKTC